MKVFLAGVYSRPRLIKKHEPLFILESYHYAKDHLNFVKEVFDNNVEFLLDSGAFSYFGKGAEIGVDWNQYVNEYVDFIKKFNIQNFIELDLYALIGINETERLRNIIEAKTKKKVIPVFHKKLGIDYFKQLCEKYDYIAIAASGKFDTKWTRSEPDRLKRMVLYANSKGVKVHGLGYTKIGMLKHIPFHSVDSTSWLSGSRFANVYKFNGFGLKKHTRPKEKKMKHYTLIDDNNFSEWIKFQKYANNTL